MVGTYTPSIAPLEAPVSDCGMGLGGAEASTGVTQTSYSAMKAFVFSVTIAKWASASSSAPSGFDAK